MHQRYHLQYYDYIRSNYGRNPETQLEPEASNDLRRDSYSEHHYGQQSAKTADIEPAEQRRESVDPASLLVNQLL